MAMTPAEKSRAARDRARGGPPREPKPHGTRAAIRRHERANGGSGEPLCAECSVENARLSRAYYLANRERILAAAKERRRLS